MDFIAEHKDFFGIGSLIIIFIVANWVTNRSKKRKVSTDWQGYFGYQVSGPSEVQVLIKSDVYWVDYTRDFGVSLLGMKSDTVNDQIAEGLNNNGNEIVLSNHLGEVYSFRKGPGQVIYRQMLAPERPVMKVSPGVRYEVPVDKTEE